MTISKVVDGCLDTQHNDTQYILDTYPYDECSYADCK